MRRKWRVKTQNNLEKSEDFFSILSEIEEKWEGNEKKNKKLEKNVDFFSIISEIEENEKEIWVPD